MKRLLIPIFVLSLAAVLAAPGPLLAFQTVESSKVSQAPVIDGRADDTAWSAGREFTVQDARLKVAIRLKTVYTEDNIFFLVSFPDDGEDRLHKPWVWSEELEAYKMGPQREDTFTFKWSLSGNEVDLSNFSDDDYTADVWYWKANRTDPAGYSDDKMHILGSEEGKKSMALTSRSGKPRYLVRVGDQGAAAQKKVLLTEYRGDVQDQYASQEPDGSHADIRAKGLWRDGAWTIEFARALETGHEDDISFAPASGGTYLFGVSIAGLYGEEVDDSRPHPYGQGRISEALFLKFR